MLFLFIMSLKPLSIASLKLKNPLLLSPMVDVTDLPYRLLCRKAGASLAYTEMIYISAILHENKKTKDLMSTSREDKPIGLQITGNNVSEFSKVLPYLSPYNLIDINCGCPSIRITGNQAGSFLLKNPEKIASMIKILKQSGKPVTAKIRLGFHKNNAVKIAKTIEKAGADALTVHARLAIHGSSVPADHKWTKKIKESIGIPLIANGDIFTGEQTAELLDFADGVMIARGAIGNPLIFRNILHYLKTGKEKQTTTEEKLKQFEIYLKLVKQHKLIDIHRIKHLGSSFLSGFKGASSFRNKLMFMKNIDEIENLVSQIH